MATDHQPLEHRIVFLDGAVGGGALYRDAHSGAETFAQVSGVLGFVLCYGVRLLQCGSEPGNIHKEAYW